MKRLKLSGREILLFTIPVLVLLGIGVRSYRADKLRPALTRLAGGDAIDCSCAATTPYSARLRQMTNCQASNWKLKKAFYTYDEVAQDGFAMNDSGQLYVVKQEPASWLKPPAIKVWKCEGVSLAKAPGGSTYFWTKKRTRILDAS